MKKIKMIVSALIFCLLFAGCNRFFRYILIDDTTSYTRITFHEMYEQDNIDVLFVGSSHCYRTFIPEIFDSELGMNTYNAGTSSQCLDGSYMVIQEAARYNDIKHIYLEVYYEMAFVENKDRDMTSTYIISDYLKPSLDKVQYLINASTIEHYFNSFILGRRNWSKFFDAEYVKNLIIQKQTEDYKNYEYTYVTYDSEWYAGKGYVANNGVIENWNFFSEKGWDNINIEGISDDWLKSLTDIITFCDKNGIVLTLVSTPMSNFLLTGLGNYDDYVNMIRDLIKDTDVEYYDFNLCKEEYFSSTSSLFMDDHHLNCDGAEQFSYLLSDVINGEISEEELFYDSFEEKIENLEPTVFGICYHDDQEVRTCKIVSNYADDLEYAITLVPNGGEPNMLQNFAHNNIFTIAPNEHGTCTIAYRLSNSSDEVQTVDVTY
ncbi:MAG: hypothetical protein NC417_00820 [Candidatus Gastranaerophilales bacterium]|nr:hypothetical protein [Candidatus Gastranaerophilales bacterium]